MTPFLKRKPALLLALPFVSAAVWAQSVPDSGAILRDTQQQPTSIPHLPNVPKKDRPAPVVGPRVVVKSFDVVGSTHFDATTWKKVLADLVGQELGLNGLQAAADRISLHYRKAGLHALAYLPEQSLKDGIVQINVVEGRLGKITLSQAEAATQTQHAIPATLLERILQRGQTPGEILNVDALESATLIANDIPGLKVSSLLRAGVQPGETDVLAQVATTPMWAGNVLADNHDPRSTGRGKAVASLGVNNGLGWGEQFLLGAQLSEGKQYGSLGYSMPLMANGLRAGLNLARLDYTLQGSFASTGGEGHAHTWGASLNYPILRSQATNLLSQLSYSHSHLVNDTSAGNVSDKVNQNLTLALNFNHSDGLGGGSVNIAGVSWITGKTDLSANAADLAQDQAGANTQGRFDKLALNLARLQRVSQNGLLWLSANGQVAFDNLDSGEDFSLGGANGVRAYPALEASGDEGVIVTAEYRHSFAERLQAKVFYDWGSIRINHDNAVVNAALNRYSLRGMGIGLDWTPRQGTNLRATVAWRDGDNPAANPATGDDGDGTKRRPQVWLSAQMDF